MPKKKWSRLVEEHGVRVRLFQRGASIYRDVTIRRTLSENGKQRSQHDVKSLGHSDRRLAIQQAKELCRRIAAARLAGVTPSAITLGQLFDHYRLHKLPTLSRSWARSCTARLVLFERAWGRDLKVASVDPTRIDSYCRQRRNLEVVSPGLEPDLAGKHRRGFRRPLPVRDGTLDAEFRWLHSVFAWARDHKKANGESLLSANPLPRTRDRRREVGWPKERTPRRPVASHERFIATNVFVDIVDPEGRLRAILALARFTGRRESAICNLMASDLLLSQERIRSAIASEGMDERDAASMPFGAIRWSAQHDKQGLLFITALSQDARREVDVYLRRSPRRGDVALFPAPRNASKPICRETAAKWLVKAERLAELPKIKGGVYHPYRRLFASERRHLPDIDVAAAAGWKDPATMRKSYQQANAAGIFSAVQNINP